eukprot:3469111-Amphidinium_carterae.4
MCSCGSGLPRASLNSLCTSSFCPSAAPSQVSLGTILSCLLGAPPLKEPPVGLTNGKVGEIVGCRRRGDLDLILAHALALSSNMSSVVLTSSSLVVSVAGGAAEAAVWCCNVGSAVGGGASIRELLFESELEDVQSSLSSLSELHEEVETGSGWAAGMSAGGTHRKPKLSNSSMNSGLGVRNVVYATTVTAQPVVSAECNCVGSKRTGWRLIGDLAHFPEKELW